MGKSRLTGLGTVFAMVLGLASALGADNARADIQWLPKYQAKFAKKRSVSCDNPNSLSCRPTPPDPLSCEAKGWLSEIPANQTCSPKYLVDGIKCWSDCKCEAKYKYAKGKGVAGGCPNGQTVNDDACGGLYSGCVDCSTNTQVSSG
ncbi:MAG: hypothetical protein KHX55_07995, partial [Proteobacteria bacterium]|nr:hypothetical protein [Pseudomonadota bacterium]